MEGTEAQLFSIEVLREFSTRVFLHFGVSELDATEAADVLVSADLRGIVSPGVARRHTYFELFNEGRINPRPQMKVIRSTPSTASVDGDNGLGLVIGPQANRVAMDLAKSAMGWVSFGVMSVGVISSERETWADSTKTDIYTFSIASSVTFRFRQPNDISVANSGFKVPSNKIGIESPG